ncbi:unnamed protein product [Cylindrotheca closterium]|uniref:Uncharacterized protein n=1 Tax=Cylindrotheca closterium TaxID=2856 RepID=A0AAD2GAV9_9STRA|nr:unnamed protein product [Cylindrotheca closterium]
MWVHPHLHTPLLPSRLELQSDTDQQALFDEASAKWTSYGDAVDYNFAYLRQDETFPQFQVTVRNSTTIGVDTVYGQPQDRYVFTMDQLLGYISESLIIMGSYVSLPITTKRMDTRHSGVSKVSMETS